MQREKIYTGVGSRAAADDRNAMALLRECGRLLALDGWILRSGAAKGADDAFEKGCISANGRKEIYLPWKGFSGRSSGICVDDPRASQMAALIHPAWSRCNANARQLHSRNIPQVLGRDLETPSNFCLCWTQDGKDSGGTRTAIVLSRRMNVPVLNLNEPGFSMSAQEVVKYMNESI